jgi:hypothetical protein
MKIQTLLFFVAYAVRCSNAAFNILTGFDATIQDAFGISSKCLAAMYVYRTAMLPLVDVLSTETQRLLAMNQLPKWLQ